MKGLRTYQFIFLLLFAGFSATIVWFNLDFPLCVYPESLESLIKYSSLVLVFALFLGFVVFNKRGKHYFVLLFLVSGAVFLTAQYRSDLYDKYSWSFDGIVSKKYKSTNHDAKTITVSGVNYELLPKKLWEKVKKGDEVKKQACSSIVSINGIKINIF